MKTLTTYQVSRNLAWSFILIFIWTIWTFAPLSARSDNFSSLAYEGVLTDASGNYVNLNGVDVTFSIVNGTSCVIFQEKHPAGDASGNVFHRIGTGTTLLHGGPLSSNHFTSSVSCMGGGSSNTSSGYSLKIEVSSHSFSATMPISAVPFAMAASDSAKLNGKSDSAFVNITTDVTQTKADSLFGSYWDKLVGLVTNNLDGSGNYTGNITGNAATATNATYAATAGNVTGTVAIANGGTGATSAAGARTNLGLGPLAALATSGTANTTTFLRGDGAWTNLPTSAITALTGDVTASGTGSVAATVANVGGVTAANVATGVSAANAATNTNAASKIVKRDASGNFSAGTITATSFDGNLTGNVTGNVTGSASNNVLKAGDSMTGALTMNAASEVRFADSDSSNYVGFRSPATVSTNKIWTLPSTDGTSGQVLKTDGAGVLSWVSTATGTVTSVTAGSGLTGGTITGSGTIGLGTELAALNNVSTTGFVNRTGAGTYSTTSANTAASNATLVQRTAAGVSGFYGVDIQGSTSGSVTLQAPSVVTNYSVTFPNTQGGAGQVLSNNGSGVLSWASVGTGSVTNIATGTGLSGGPISTTGTISLANTTVSQGSYGSATQAGTFTVDAQGRLTAAGNTTITPEWSSIASKPTTLSGYGITNAVANGGGTGTITSGLDASKPSSPTTGDVFIATDAQKIYRWTGAAWNVIATGTASNPGGSTKSIQYKNGTTFAGSGNFTWDESTTEQSIYGGTTGQSKINLGWDTSGSSKYWQLYSSGSSYSDTGRRQDFGISHNSNGAWTEGLTITKDGNVGFGASGTVLNYNNLDSGTPKFVQIHNANSGTTGLHLTNASHYGATSGLSIDFQSSNQTGRVWNYENAPLTFGTGAANRMTILGNGNVGINTTTPQATLQVNGAITTPSSPFGASWSIDFATSNIAYTSNSCGTFTLSNMKDGGTYQLAIKGTGPGTCSFIATGLNIKMPPGHGPAIAGTHTLYSFLVVDSDVYVSWVPGY